VTALLVTLVACGFLCGMATWAAVGSRRSRRQRRTERADEVRTALFRTLDQPDESARIIDGLVASDRKLLEIKARAVLPALRGEDRETLARLLESRGATDAARRQCRSRRASDRVAGCRLLGDVGSYFAVLDLAPLLDDPRLSVRVAAAGGLGRLGQPTGVAALLAAVAGENPLPIDVAADAIQQIRDWPVSQLQPMLSDPTGATRGLAVELLGRVHALDSVPALLDILAGDQDSEVRVRAARALGRIGSPRAVHILIENVPTGPPRLQMEAISALGKLGVATAVPTLRVALLSPSAELSRVAAAALCTIAPTGVELLQEISDDDHHPARVTAHRALAAHAARAALKV